MLCTHEHLDHLDPAGAPRDRRRLAGAVFVVPTPIVDQVAEWGSLPTGCSASSRGRHEVAGFTVDAVPACHGVTMDDAYGFGEELSGGAIRFLGYVIDAGGVRIYHAGDPFRGHGGVGACSGPDVALLPVNGRHAEREARGIVGNLNEREAAWLAAEVGAETLIPMHHDMFVGNLGSAAAVVEAAEQESRSVAVLVPPRDEPFVVAARRAVVKALVYLGPRRMELQDVPDPRPSPATCASGCAPPRSADPTCTGSVRRAHGVCRRS